MQRSVILYPGISENWIIIHKINALKKYIIYISSLENSAHLRQFITWLPFIIAITVFLINCALYIHNLIKQNRIAQKDKNSIHIDNFDRSSKILAIRGFSFLISFVFGGIFLTNIYPSFKIVLPNNDTKQSKPNVFMFAIDSFRYDIMKDDVYKNIMPNLIRRSKNAKIFKPMLIGNSETFPSWVEIATGTYSINNGVRTMYPPKSTKTGEKSTLYNDAIQNGYSTLFISDFAGNIFKRYPFGADEINTPDSNLSTLLENLIITLISPLQSLLIFPKLQSLLPSIHQSPEISDPRLVAALFAKSLSNFSRLRKPVFVTTFFSTSQFPYAAPAPWYARFQKKFNKDQMLFKSPLYEIYDGDSKNQIINQKNILETRALYYGALNSIDETLEEILKQLEKKGWLKNSIILIFGDHGEDLFENDNLGHGKELKSEYSTTTPLLIFLNGNANTSTLNSDNLNLVRNIDIAPTLSKRLNFNVDEGSYEGVSLLDINEKLPQFPLNNHYMESGNWFNFSEKIAENKNQFIYPNLLTLLDIDPKMNYEFYLKPIYSQTIASLKERSWSNDTFKLVLKPSKKGMIKSLYNRSDKNSEHDLLIEHSTSEYYKSIANEMLNKLNSYLQLQGVEIINNNNSFLYSENLTE